MTFSQYNYHIGRVKILPLFEGSWGEIFGRREKFWETAGISSSQYYQFIEQRETAGDALTTTIWQT